MSQLCQFAPVLVLGCFAALAAGRDIRLEFSPQLDAPERHGIAALSDALKSRGHTVNGPRSAQGADLLIVASVKSGEQDSGNRCTATKELSSAPESLFIRKTNANGSPTLVLCGSDGVGLMYAALDTADRILWTRAGADPLAYVSDRTEAPYLIDRGVTMYTMQRALFERRLHDENHWKRYFDLLARSRLNSFTVIFGYENGGFMAPPYPYFFDTPGYDTVRLVGITRDQQQRNTDSFKRLIRIAHERGIRVTAAIWDHIYRGGVQGGGIPGASDTVGKAVPGLVTGVTPDNLAAYTKTALRTFMAVFPEIDGLEFRMHTESGLKREEMQSFWHEVFGLLKDAKPDIAVTLRAKDVPDAIIDDALQQRLKIRIETKYWMEQMGLPYHPTHVNVPNQHDRRHGYADLLRYPQQYRVHWRLWSGGTTRLLQWADPEYVRRYAESARLYDGNSLDVNEMLATWMLGEPHDREPMPLLTAQYRSSDDAFERYWPFYQVWGRLSYNPSTPAEVWQRAFEQRFGAAGVDLMNGLHLASQVLPRVVAAAYRYRLFPTTRGWAEMMSQGSLAEFADLEGTDIEQFQNPRDAARSLLSGLATSKRRPEETAQWFADISERVMKHARRVDESAEELNAEGMAMLADIKILASLARYYSQRLPAAVAYNVYRETKDPHALDAAIDHERRAVAAWEQIVKSAGDVYSKELPFGVHAVGFPRHWREELVKLQNGIEQLQAERNTASPVSSDKRVAAFLGAPPSGDAEPPSVELLTPERARPGEDLLVRARARDASGIKSLRLRYRRLTQFEDYATVEMSLDAKTGVYSAVIPGGFITPRYDVMFFVEALDNKGNGRNWPDLDRAAPYIVVPVDRAARAGR